MTCAEFEITVHQYLRDALTPDERAELELHRTRCDRCRDLMKQLEELRCRDFVEFLNDFLDGSQEPARASVFERHLTLCPDCRAYMHSYKRTMELSVSSLRGTDLVPEEIPDALVSAILAARK